MLKEERAQSGNTGSSSLGEITCAATGTQQRAKVNKRDEQIPRKVLGIKGWGWGKGGGSFRWFYITLKAWSKLIMQCRNSPGHGKTACSCHKLHVKTEKAGTAHIAHVDYSNSGMLGKLSNQLCHICSPDFHYSLRCALWHAKSTWVFTTVSFPYLCTAHGVLML